VRDDNVFRSLTNSLPVPETVLLNVIQPQALPDVTDMINKNYFNEQFTILESV
jgi:hypothetical protein